jgi:hypothetical protein
MLRAGRAPEALEMLAPGESRIGDDLLRLQYEGIVAHYAGEYRRSSAALEEAFRLQEDRYTRSVSAALLSMLASDRVLAYSAPFPERLLLHYYGAMNYLRLGEPDEAAVEARRLGHLLGRSLEGDEPGVPPPLGRTLSLFSGAVFEAAGQWNDAEVAHRRARAFGGGTTDADGDATARAPVEGARGPVEIFAGRPPPASPVGEGHGEVLVVLERGFVAHRVEEDLTLLLLPDEWEEMREIRRGVLEEDGEGTESRLLRLARRVEARSLSRHRRHRAARRDGDGEPVLLRVAWPAYRQWPLASGPASLRVRGDDTAGVLPASPRRADLSRAVREAYRERRTLDVAKTLLRAVTKAALAEGIEEAVSTEDETLGEVLGWSARIAGALLERADTRSWHLLPARLELFRIRLPAGTHRLEARVPGRDASEESVALGSVEVRPGGITVVSARAWE